ncbi:hypothetical protein L9F63_025092 [Diploptera punctata]|uniref:ZBR-type domain-containing protein n=1 Tax=Diploptera punctata TaxID=6984 RepID=A0AAD7ZCJ8_DIPPU|nr:hypothetical protein L9F63_025092 [Diploptera punctata]
MLVKGLAQDSFTRPNMLSKFPRMRMKKQFTFNLSTDGDNTECVDIRTKPVHKSHCQQLASFQVASSNFEEDSDMVFSSCTNVNDTDSAINISHQCTPSFDSGFRSNNVTLSFSPEHPCSEISQDNSNISLTVTIPISPDSLSSFHKPNVMQTDTVSESITVSNEEETIDDLESFSDCTPYNDSPFQNNPQDEKMEDSDPVFSAGSSCNNSDPMNMSSESCFMFPYSKDITISGFNSQFSDFSQSSDSIVESGTFDQMLIDTKEDVKMDFNSADSLPNCDIFSVLEPAFLDINAPLLGGYSNEKIVHSTPRATLLRREKVDFLSLLGAESAHPQIVKCIFSYLKPRDLTAVAVVSKTWKKILEEDSTAYRHAQSYLEHRQKNKEKLLRPSALLCEAAFFLQTKKIPKAPLASRTNLREIQNIDLTSCITPIPPTSPPVSPSKRRFYQFFKAGRNLENGKSLSPCPRCSLPSQVDNNTSVGQCTREGCQYCFCTKCKCESHSSGSCPVTLLSSQHSRKRLGAICSKQSKKNLRRL